MDEPVRGELPIEHRVGLGVCAIVCRHTGSVISSARTRAPSARSRHISISGRYSDFSGSPITPLHRLSALQSWIAPPKPTSAAHPLIARLGGRTKKQNGV